MNRPHRPRRPGYAMLLVIAFLVLLTAFWGVACRQTAALLRVETARSKSADPLDLPGRALAIAMTLLETGTPHASPYSGTLSVMNSVGTRTFLVTFSRDATDTSLWVVTVSANLGDPPPDPLPDSFP